MLFRRLSFINDLYIIPAGDLAQCFFNTGSFKTEPPVLPGNGRFGISISVYAEPVILPHLRLFTGLPNIGAKVKVTGIYGETFTKATSGAATNPRYGIMTSEKIEFVEPPTEPALLPGMKKR